MDKITDKALEFDKIKDELSKCARFSQSKKLCFEIHTFDEPEKIKKQLRYTSEAKVFLDQVKELPIEYIADIKSIRNNIALSYLSEQELVDCAKTMRSSRLVKNFLNENSQESSILKELAKNLVSERDIETKIFDTFDENLNIKQNASVELKGLYSALNDTEQNLKTTVSSLLNNPNFSKYLQENIYTQRDDRIVFQVVASNKTKVPGLIHDVSASAKTFYIEPEQLVPINNKIRELRAQIHQECIKILVNLTSLVKDKINDLVAAERILAEMDFHFAKARYALKLHACEPEIADEKILVFENMKHPLLIAKGVEVIANNFEIGKDYKSVVITGSNTGGKTVTLKTVGLFIKMAESGMFIPCTFAKIYPFSKVYADIGDSQNILENLSTFSAHMSNIIEILKLSDENSFVLLDEICSGTDPVEGSVLAKTILEKMSKKGVYCVVTTHYGELKSLEYSNNYFRNASVEFDTNTLHPTYKLIMGIPGLSNAISIASNLGLDEDIIRDAKSILINQKDPSIAVVEQLQLTQQELSQNLDKAKELKENSESLKNEYENNIEKIKKEKSKTIKNLKNKFEAEIMSARAEIKDILDEMRKEKSEKIARRSYSRIAKLERDFRDGVEKASDKPQYLEIDWDKVVIGDIVLIKNLNQQGKVASLPDKNSRLFIDMGSMKMKLKKDELAAPYGDSIQDVKSQIPVSSYKKFELRKHNISQTLDLRGYRVEEALDSLEKYLDSASLANLSPVTVIHGHGTGALKEAVREFLKTSPYVREFRAGGDGEGGDGVCVVEIK